MNHSPRKALPKSELKHHKDSQKYLFSYFKNAKAVVKQKDIFLNEYLAIISDPARKSTAQKLRALPLDEYKTAKVMQSCITGSCIMDNKGRSKINTERLNGLCVVDFDELPAHYDNWASFKSDLTKDPYTFIVHYSLSGWGLCVFVKIEVLNEFRGIYLSLEEYYNLVFEAKIDFLADETRLRFISFDANPYHNPDSLEYIDAIAEPKAEQPKGNDFDSLESLIANTPAEIFNYSGFTGLELVNELLTELGYIITAGKKPTIFEYQRAGGSLKSLVAFYNSDVVKFQVFSSNTGLTKEHYNLFDLYKELKGITDYEAQKELSLLGFGVFNESEAKPIKANGKESYSLTLEYLAKEEISLNQLTGVIEKNGLPLNDFHISNMLTELSLFSGKNQSKDILLSCLDVIANGNQYHPFLNFVKELQAVEKTDLLDFDELDKFIECFTSDTPKKTIRIYFIRWMLGLFDLHINQRMTKNVLVVSGTQNSCKTSLSKNILFDSLKQYGKVTDFNQNKMTDSKIALCSLLVACFDEFEEILSKHRTLAEFKNLTSSYDIFERRPYRRNHEQMFRAAIVMATTNEKNILTDSTGNTRFLTLDVKAFDLESYFKIDLLKLWRVIYDLHLLGQTSVLDETERVLQADENLNFESEDFCEALIENIFCVDSKGLLNTTDILIELERHTKQSLSLKRIGSALRKMGIERIAKKIKGKVYKGYGLKIKYE